MLHKFFDFILRFMGYVPRHRERLLAQELILLEQEIYKLENEITELKDENVSLWGMLDEIHKSDISKNQNAIKLLMQELQETLTEGMMDEMLKDFKPVGEA
tara:strand:+ start:3111 stop:3413 length:303 start_codon:yes stop_codon:yes gene_type:complete